MSQSQWTARIIILVKKAAKVIVFLFAFMLIYQLAQLWAARNTTRGQAPEIQATSIAGDAVSLHALRGKPTLLYFWASWCPICRFEHAAITRLAEDYQVLSVAMQSGSNEDISIDMAEHGAQYPVVNDPDGMIAMRYGIRGVPTSLIIDSQGKIDTVLKGYTMETALRLRLWRLSP